jgi:gluconolactonase
MSENATHDGWNPSLRYPDPAIEILDKRFQKYLLNLASVERLYTGTRWGEGPVYFGDGRYLLWTDFPNERIMKWDEASGAVSVFRQPSNKANGNTRDRQGRLVTCEHGRRVTRTEYDGTITVLADGFEGKKLNSPNDVVVKSDGSIWFTDPTAGLRSWYEGQVEPQELPMNVYRIDGQTGKMTVVEGGLERPNGLAFSPDETKFYLVYNGQTPRQILVYDVVADGTKIANPKSLVRLTERETPDGFRIDTDGNLWCGWGMGPEHDGVMVFAPDGDRLAHIHLPERVANVCFGGRHRNRLFMAAAHSLYALYVNTQGVKGG